MAAVMALRATTPMLKGISFPGCLLCHTSKVHLALDNLKVVGEKVSILLDKLYSYATSDGSLLPTSPGREQVVLLCSIPGVSERIAYTILAEIGSKMARFPTA